MSQEARQLLIVNATDELISVTASRASDEELIALARALWKNYR